MKMAALAALCSLALGSPGVTAQQTGGDVNEALQVPGFVVTATRTALEADRLSIPVTVLLGSELRERGIRSVSEALRSVPGATVVQAGAAGAQTSLFLRGGQSNYVRVLVDGVPINEAGGAIDLADLSTDQVERIEVLRGPASVVYGSEAVTGVIQIFTTRGRGEPRLELSAMGGLGEQRHETGRYGLSEFDATLSGGSSSLSWAVGGSRVSTDGAYPINSARTLQSANGRIGWSGHSGTDVNFTARFSDSEAGFPTDGAGNLVDENAAIDRRLLLFALEGGQALSERFEVRVLLGHMTRDQLAHDEPDSPADTLGTFRSYLESHVARRSADVRLNAAVPRGTFTVGAAHEIVDGETSYDSESEFGPYSAEAEYERSNSAVYLQLLNEPVSGLHLTMGVRLDRNQEFGDFRTFRLGSAWQGWTGGRLRGAIGQAFREPTFAENFGSGFGDEGSPDLVPERTRSWEIGIEQEVGPALLGVSWFDQSFRDMIQYTFTAPDPGGPNYFNVGAAESVGLEASAEVRMNPVTLTGSWTQLSTRVLDPGLATDQTFVEGRSLLRRPRHSGSLGARLTLDDGSVAATVNIVGRRDDLDFGAGFPAPRVTLARNTTLDLSAEHGLSAFPVTGARVLVRIDNALDSEFESISGFPAPGRIVRLGLRVTPGG
jgi:vitamin B12 transporter